MARKRIEEIVVDLKFEGAEELKKISSGFRELAKAMEPSDRLIEKARQQINEYAAGLGNSEQALKGQIEALKALRVQATIGGGVYRQLSTDVSVLSGELKKLEQEFKAVGKAAKQTDAQIAEQFPARRPEAYRVQLAALRRELDGLSVSSRKYGDALTEITIRQAAFGRAQARQGVIAAAQAVGAPLIGAMTPQQELPKTTAALRLQISELRQDLDNTNYTLTAYKQRLGEIKTLQEELDRVTGNANKTRKQEIRDRIENLKAINQENAALREQSAIDKSIARGRARRAAIAGRGLTGAMFTQPEAPSELFRSIGALADQSTANTAQLMKRSYSEVAQEIRTYAAASDGSVRSLQRQRDAWQNLRVTMSPLKADYRQVAQEADRAIQGIDRQMQRLQSRRRRMTGMQATQAAGAVISGSIFGGPEGALGGVLGTAFGGVPGAFAGAAAGAQIGMIRKQIGSFAEMSSEINRLRLGLAGVSNDLNEFVEANRLTEESSKKLQIPLVESYKIMTQLRANTVELGLSLKDTQTIFEGTAAAVLKTGGSLGDVQGAMTAVVQVLSKGKPQAEEIRKQLGDRLPGAVVLFARETGRSMDELQQAFKEGSLTVDDFLQFVKGLSRDSTKFLDQVGTNAEFAGQRYQKALETVQLSIGKMFESTGSAMQNVMADALYKLDSLINKMMELGLIQSPSYYFDQLSTGALKVEDVEKRILELAARMQELENVPRTWLTDMLGLNPEPELRALEDALIRLRRIEQATRTRDVERQKQEDDKNAERRAQSLLQAIEQRENAIAQARIQLEEQAAQIRKQAIEQARQLEERLAQQRLSRERELAATRRELASTQQDVAFELAAVTAAATGGDPELIRIQQRITEAARQRDEERIRLEQALLDEQTERAKAIEQLKVTTASAVNEANLRYAKAIGDAQREYARAVARIIEEGTGRAGQRLEAAGKIAAAYIQRATLNQQIIGVSGFAIPEPTAAGGYTFPNGTFSGADLLQAQAFADVKIPLQALLALDKDIKKFTQALASLPTATAIVGPAIKGISVNIDDLLRSVTGASAGIDRLNKDYKEMFERLSATKFGQVFVREGAQAMQGVVNLRQNLQQEYDKIQNILDLRQQGMSGSLAERVDEIQTSFSGALAGLNQAFESARAQASPEQLADLEEFYNKLKTGLFDAQIAAMGLADALANLPTNLTLQIAVENIKDELNELLNVGNQLVGAANAIGDAFGNAFKGLITGATSAQEALANFFSSLADYFADMAAKMIAQWIKLAILNTIVKIFPGGGVGDPLSSQAGLDAAIGRALGNANGNAFAQNGIVPYAKGGVVSSPTLFKFARGGTMQTGVMGEAGPEAIMPLKRGPDGKLGVQATGGGGITVNVNVDAKGTNVQGDAGQGAALARVVAGAVQQELIKQQRPGGILTGGR